MDYFAKRSIDNLLQRLFGSSSRIEAFWRVVRFGIIGVGSTLLYGILALTFHYMAGIPAAAASFMAQCCSAVFSYFGHRVFTFQDSGKIGRSAPRFIVINVVVNLVVVGVPWIVSDLMGYPAILSIGMVCILVPVMNYASLNFFVFHNVRSKSHHPV